MIAPLRRTLLATVISLAATTGAMALSVVNVVCVTEEWCEALREPFFAKTGIRMEYLNLRTNESLVRIRADHRPGDAPSR